jgi:hypothetical protein
VSPGDLRLCLGEDIGGWGDKLPLDVVGIVDPICFRCLEIGLSAGLSRLT